MSQGKIIISMLVTLVIGLAGGFLLRPMFEPTQQAEIAAHALPSARVSSEARGTRYFVTRIDEARQIVAGCRDGSVRGDECATAEEAIIKVDAAERRKKFLGN